MRMADGFADGEVVEVERRSRLSDEELTRVRRRWMAEMRRHGVKPEEIGQIFRYSSHHVRREIRALEREQRRDESA